MQTSSGLLKYLRMAKTFQFAGERGFGLRHLPVVIVLNPPPYQPYESHLLSRVRRVNRGVMMPRKTPTDGKTRNSASITVIIPVRRDNDCPSGCDASRRHEPGH